MASPQKSPSGDIDLFSVDEASSRSAAPCPEPIAFVDSPAHARRYHSIQLAIVTGFFACGGLLCSLFFVDGDNDSPQPHHWLRKSYSSPAMTLPPAPPGASIVPQNVPPRSNPGSKTAAPQRPRISHRELASSPGHIDRSSSGIRPVIALRTQWANFSENLRAHAASARNLTLDLGRRLRQYRFEPRKLFTSDQTDIHTDDAG
jgi:hypothetical protein